MSRSVLVILGRNIEIRSIQAQCCGKHAGTVYRDIYRIISEFPIGILE